MEVKLDDASNNRRLAAIDVKAWDSGGLQAKLEVPAKEPL